MDNNWVENEFKQAYISDERIFRRVVKTVSSLSSNSQASLPQALGGWKETKSCYRMLDNKKVTKDVILSGHKLKTIERMKEHETVLVIQDTTDFDFTHHPSTTEIGLYCQSEKRFGLLMHSALAVTAEGVPLGVLSQKFWFRESIDKTRDHKKLPIEQKESYKWIESMDESLYEKPSNAVTVCDRESDIYEFFSHAQETNNKVLVRMCRNRRIVDENAKDIKELINIQSSSGELIIQVPRNTRENLPSRTAKVEIKFCRVTIRPTKNNTFLKNAANINLWVVSIEETSIPPKGVKPIHWILLTNIPVEDSETATEMIKWYSHRWRIERFHYTLKSGFNIDEIQLGTGERIEKLIAIYSIIAWQIMYITYESRENPEESCNVIFKDHEWKSLYCFSNNTPIPPTEPPTIKEAVIMIATLGGFLGRKSDGNPGLQVLWKGMARLFDISNTWLIAHSTNFSQ